MRPSTVSRLLAVLLVTALAVSAPAATGQDLESVERQLGLLEDDVADATAAYEDLWAEVVLAEERLGELADRQVRYDHELAQLETLLAEQARTLFMRGPDSILTSLLTADGPQSAIERAALMVTLTARERAALEAVASLRVQAEQSRTLLASHVAELEAMRAELARHRADLEAKLGRVQAVAGELRARAARQRTIQREDQRGTYACIFEEGTSHFRNTWGAPRSGGRRHKGTDVFSWFDAPVYAFTSGVVERVSTSRLGGLGLYLEGDDGNLYYYAHLNRIADGISIGERVEAGEPVAHNGHSGNADAYAPHVHFEMHPGGGAPKNPYAWLAAACY